MKQAIQAQYKNNFKLELTTQRDELKSIIQKLQYLYDHSVYSERFSLYTEKNLKGGMFSVIFNYEDPNLDFVDIVEEVYDDYFITKLNKRNLAIKLQQEHLENSRVISQYLSKNDLDKESLEALENDIDKMDSEVVQYEVELKRSEITSDYMQILSDMTQDLIEEIEIKEGTIDHEIVLPILDIRLKATRKDIDRQWKEELAKHERNAKSFFGY